MDGDLVFYQFSRSKIERGDFRHFLELYAFEKLPTNRRLRELMNSFVFCIDGWDDDEREISCVPEIRRFYAAFHAAWPYWLYFCNLETDTLKSMVVCLLPSIEAGKVDGQPAVAVAYNPMELLSLLTKDFGFMNQICERAGMHERLIIERSNAIFEYFGLPYNVPRN
jgi:hypothetical protein